MHEGGDDMRGKRLTPHTGFAGRMVTERFRPFQTPAKELHAIGANHAIGKDQRDRLRMRRLLTWATILKRALTGRRVIIQPPVFLR
jgi:hypothetical protein